jgi:hypothetical protein
MWFEAMLWKLPLPVSGGLQYWTEQEATRAAFELCAEAGAMIMPAMPAFYQMPKTLDDLADFMAGKILSALGFRHELYPSWKG